MIRFYSFSIVLMLLSALAVCWAQDESSSPPEGSVPQQPVPAYGTENPASTNPDNPPISGLDLPNLQPHAAPLSYLQAGAHFSETADSNIENGLGGNGFGSITRLLGSLELQRLWSHYDLGIDYLGGVAYYEANGLGWKQIEELGLQQRVKWKRGEFSIRDAFSYQPEGSFGSSYGDVGFGGAGLGEGSVGSVFFNGTTIGELGQVPRVMNLALGDVEEYLSPKSAITATGGDDFIHFLQDDSVLGNAFIGSSQGFAQVAYDRLFTPHDQGALAYGYERFDFSTGLSFQNQLIQLMWGHRISGRMDLVFSAGPQFTQITNSDLRISAAGRAVLRYQFPKANLNVSYAHFITSGSGLFAGATSDLARLSVTRPLTRRWTGFVDLGYSHNTRLLPQSCSIAQELEGSCPGVSGQTYQYGFVGAGARRNIGREFAVFGSYQFNYLVFDQSFCGTSGPCNRTSPRNTVTFGLDWFPRPWRID